MRTVQMIGVPQGAAACATPTRWWSRSSRAPMPAAEAVAESLAALRWLQQAGCRQFYFKYCSTFDSTDARQYRPGGRGADAGARRRFHDRLPGFPGQRPHDLQGLSVRRRRAAVRIGHARPSADADDRFEPGARAAAAGAGARSAWPTTRVVERARPPSPQRFAELRGQGCRFAVVDAVSNRDLERIGAACADMKLVTGGSGIALGLPAEFPPARPAGALASGQAGTLPPPAALRP